ncbi:uncharacterized protein LOC144548457 [Carex rostrata]
MKLKLDFLLLSCSPSSINKSKRCRSSFSSRNGSFWKKRGTNTNTDEVEDVTTSPLPSSSSSTSWSKSDFTGSDFLPSSNGSSEFIPDITNASHSGTHKKVVNTEEEEKDQLSPISVMDFPYEEEEEETAEEGISDSSSFQENLASIERERQALLQKIRRFESLAELVPVNLNNQFSDVDEESSGNPASDDDDDVNEEGLNCKTRNDSFATKLVDAANKWIESQSNCWEEQRDNCGEIVRFRCFEEEQQEVAVCLASGVLGCLINELVGELVFC